MTGLGQLAPNKGKGLTGLTRAMGGGGGIGNVVYAATLPDTSYLPADGRSIKAANYPEYARIYGQGPGYHTRKLADPSGTVTGDTSAFASAISPDGVYGVITSSTVQPVLYLYKFDETAATLVGAPGTGDASSLIAGREAAAFSLASDYLAFGGTNAPYLFVKARPAGTDNFTTPVAIVGAAVGLAPLTIAFTDDNYLLVSYNVSGFNYVGVFQVSGTTATRVAGSFPGSLPGPILQAVRNKAGTRYLFRFASAPFAKVYDYLGAGVFSEVVGALPALPTAPATIAMSATGEYVAMITTISITSVDVYRLTSPNVYASFRGLSRISSSELTWLSDDSQLLVGASFVSGFIAYQPANGAFLELARGNIGAYPSLINRRVSQNNRVLMGLGGLAGVLAYGRAPAMEDIPIPAYPTKYGPDLPLYPFVKVK